MKNKLVRNLVTLSADVLTSFAMKTSASACAFSLYQPEEPKCLRDKQKCLREE